MVHIMPSTHQKGPDRKGSVLLILQKMTGKTALHPKEKHPQPSLLISHVFAHTVWKTSTLQNFDSQMPIHLSSRLLITLFIIAPTLRSVAQSLPEVLPRAPHTFKASDLHQQLDHLLQLGSVLYIAAHPDDENTRFLAWSARGQGYRTAYLSLTRGSGGQNLIGEEKGVQLGMIRTQELLQARRVDGATQYFSRANDFGYSKTPSETFRTWDREKLLADMVWVIRQFRPDVLVTRFSPERAGKTHGHHTASAMLAQEAFEAAGDPQRFPEQLAYVEAWSPRKLYWNTSWWFYGTRNYDKSGHVPVNVGEYNPWLGKSYQEIGSAARTQHKSQGFGSSPERGALAEFFDPLDGATADTSSLMAGIETSWARIDGGKKISKLLQKARRRFDPGAPEAILPLLVKAYHQMEAYDDHYLIRRKKQQLAELMARCAGLYMDFTASRHLATPGERLETRLRTVVRRSFPIHIEDVVIRQGAGIASPKTTPKSTVKQISLGDKLKQNRLEEKALSVEVTEEAAISQPYWLEAPVEEGLFSVPEQTQRGMAEHHPPVAADLGIRFGQDGPRVVYRLPLEYTGTDPVEGEIRHKLAIAPPVTAQLGPSVSLFQGEQSQSLSLRLRRTGKPVAGTCSLKAPVGWTVSPTSFSFEMDSQKVQMDTTIQVKAGPGAAAGTLSLTMDAGRRQYDQGLQVIDYRHIPRQYHFPKAQTRLVPIRIQTGGRKIAYVPGAGDQIPESLRAIGYTVDVLNTASLNAEQLAGYDAVVMGIRFFNVEENARQLQASLLEYCHDGGTLIYQYSKSYNLQTQDIGPYPMDLSRDRVTVEEAPMEILQPDHPIFQQPNKITQEDFEGWVQERGLYFAGEWDSAYTPLLSAHDPGESPKKGMLLAAPYGQGAFVYTGLSFFRQLPAGVAGAYRLFSNLMAYQGE